MQFATEYWPEMACSVEFVPEVQPPADLPVSAVGIMITENRRLLLTKIDRGWDTPGGHIEEGETPEQAIIREVHEETGGQVGAFKRAGYLHIKQTKRTELNARYPEETCIILFTGNEIQLNEKHDFSQYEATEIRFVPFEELAKYHHNWTDMKAQILDYALARA